MKTEKKYYPFELLKSINTHRNYKIYFSNNDNVPPPSHALTDILHFSIVDDYEWAHALCEDLDKLLDLRILESMYFFPNRDAKDGRREHAIIKRIG